MNPGLYWQKIGKDPSSPQDVVLQTEIESVLKINRKAEKIFSNKSCTDKLNKVCFKPVNG